MDKPDERVRRAIEGLFPGSTAPQDQADALKIDRLGDRLSELSKDMETEKLMAKIARLEARVRELEHENARLREERDEARGVLRKVEWEAADGLDNPVCPICYAPMEDGHAPGCEWARVMGEE